MPLLPTDAPRSPVPPPVTPDETGAETPETTGLAAAISAERVPGSVGAPARRERTLLPRRFVPALVLSVVVLALFAVASGQIDALGQRFAATVSFPASSSTMAEAREETSARRADRRRAAVPTGTYTFRDHALHPDRLYQPYLGGDLLTSDGGSSGSDLILGFRRFLDTFARRQGQDDNFTVRLIDRATGETVEVHHLTDARDAYERTGQADWDAVDRLRRVATTARLDHYAARGRTRDDLDVKWGRANQVREARERDAPFIGYEIALARSLGMSLLATEIGTVETFNQDHLTSTVGARSRYQMMPDVLQNAGVRRFTLRTTARTSVTVSEDKHPLLTMEPAFLLLRGYANAVGHEMTGISSYHTGPGNVYTVYRNFISNGGRYFQPTSGVLDAYAWGVTEGYPLLSSTTSFKSYSRGYVASAYGALRATEDLPVDPSLALRAERLSVRGDAPASLARILAALPDGLNWGGYAALTPYERFRRFNPHFGLPVGRDGAIPTGGDVLIPATQDGESVRFFLPIGAVDALNRAGLSATLDRRFDERTYTVEADEETEADRAYDDLLRETERLSGFTLGARGRLDDLVTRFVALAGANPTPYRLNQLRVIRTHRGLWRTQGFEKLAAAVAMSRGETPVPIGPVEPLTPAPIPDFAPLMNFPIPFGR